MSQLPPPPGWVPPAPPPTPAPGSAAGYPPPPGPGGSFGYVPPAHKPGVVALRPLGLGDLFDGAFRTIRRNPTAMVGLAALVTTVFMVVPALVTLLLAGLGQLTSATGFDPFGTGSTSTAGNDAFLAVTYLGSLFGLVATVVLNGLLVRVVAEAVLGRRTSIGEAWAATRGRLWRLVGLMVLDVLMVLVLVTVPVVVGVLVGFGVGPGTGVAVGVLLLAAGVAAAILLHIRFFLLAPPALVLERVGVFAALRRAGRLSRQQFWRLFGITLLTALVVGVVSQVLAIPLSILGVAGPALVPGTAGALIAVFASYVSQIVVGAVTTPFTSAVVALQYVDQRIRKEGLDVELIAAAQRTPGPR